LARAHRTRAPPLWSDRSESDSRSRATPQTSRWSPAHRRSPRNSARRTAAASRRSSRATCTPRFNRR
jgi:hypothetical protein